MSEASHAVFLSYASQDAQAAQRICEALRAAGVEVWFDQSELRGGDAWDQSIRKQIKTCALFVPVISHTTHDRREGYFRLEWKLAVDRCHLMDAGMAFLLPVVIDDTRDDDRVPERFREVQWTRLPGGVTPESFVERIKRLLSTHSDSLTAPDSTQSAHGAVTIGAPPPDLGHHRAWWLYGAVVVALLTVGYFGLERLSRSKLSALGGPSVAVLPLTNESGDVAQQYFSDGISEDLITELSQVPGLKVIGRSSAFQFRDSKEDGRSIGAKLGVAHLLEGSVRKSDDMIRVSAELINTADGSTQWSERYDRPYKDLFALQDEIARAVAGALRTKLLPDEHLAGQSDRPPGGSLEAYNAFLQGRFYSSRETEADLRKAVASYAEAIQLDPKYARAWSNLAQAWTSIGANYLGGSAAQEAFSKARAAVGHALILSPDLASAHEAQGSLFLNADFNWRGAESEYSRALVLAPMSLRRYSTLESCANLGRGRAGDRAHAAGDCNRAVAGHLVQLAGGLSRRSTASMRRSEQSAKPSSCSLALRAITSNWQPSRSSAATRKAR